MNNNFDNQVNNSFSVGSGNSVNDGISSDGLNTSFLGSNLNVKPNTNAISNNNLNVMPNNLNNNPNINLNTNQNNNSTTNSLINNVNGIPSNGLGVNSNALFNNNSNNVSVKDNSNKRSTKSTVFFCFSNSKYFDWCTIFYKVWCFLLNFWSFRRCKYLSYSFNYLYTLLFIFYIYSFGSNN